MRDVAGLAGVSTMTVSRVVAHPERVSEPTRRRVQQVIDQLGYVPDRIAGSLSSQRTGFVATILPTLHNSNFADTARALSGVLRGAGFQPLFGFTDYSIAEEEAMVRAMLARRPEGIVLTGGNHTDATRQMLAQADVPVVEIWDLPEKPIDHAIGFSNFEVGRAMTRHLIGLGYRAIAFFGRAAHHGFRDFRGEARMEGHLAALRQAGLPADLVVCQGTGPVTFAHGAECLASLIDNGTLSARRVDAVMTVSDLSAVGALCECQRRGIRVPEDLAIAGFGDFEIAGLSVPPISTVRVDCALIGAEAGRLLIGLLRHPAREGAGWEGDGPQVRDVGFRVLARESTARVRATVRHAPTDLGADPG
ncbi:MAG: LacI family DNA-binding transcriptional regulator [Alphaproteobacteria bacterium]